MMKRLSSSSLIAACAALGCSFANTAFAAEPPPPAPDTAAPAGDEDEATKLYKQGHDLYEQGKPAEAEKAYQAAWDLRQSFDVAANLGNVELVIGQTRDAAEH